MNSSDLLGLILGNGGVLVLLVIIAVYLGRENKTLKEQNTAMHDARLKDAKDAEMLALAYLELRKQDAQGISP